MSSTELVPVERVPIRRIPITLSTPDTDISQSPDITPDTSQLAPKLSPKLIEFARWDKIDEVNARLDKGDSVYSVHNWVKKQGFSISHVWVGEYAKIRKKALVDNVSMEHILGILGKPVFDVKDLATKSTKEKLKSEIDALDLLIQGGYQTLLHWGNKPVSPKLMMDAIRLKNDLTAGHHGFLTNFGMEHLRDIETTKYNLILNHLLSFIPEDKRNEAVSKISEIEDKYYQSTDYYEEYLRASGELNEVEIEKKLQVWRANKQLEQH